MNRDIFKLVRNQYLMRTLRGGIPSIKVNLYKDYEIRAVLAAIGDIISMGLPNSVDCMMIADSYLTTHLGRDQTTLFDFNQQETFLLEMKNLVKSASLVFNQTLAANDALYLIADMPDGSLSTITRAIRNAEAMCDSGAEVLKVELISEERLAIVQEFARRGIAVMVHMGYTPQRGENKTHGQNVKEIRDIFLRARQARDAGAIAIVLERVGEIANEVLCRPSDNGIPIYSIFSGKALYGGQSLNVWDSVFLPPFEGKFFPPTAKYKSSLFPEIYSEQTIREHFRELLKLTLEGVFPLSPRSKLTNEDKDLIRSLDPWS